MNENFFIPFRESNVYSSFFREFMVRYSCFFKYSYSCFWYEFFIFFLIDMNDMIWIFYIFFFNFERQLICNNLFTEYIWLRLKLYHYFYNLLYISFFSKRSPICTSTLNVEIVYITLKTQMTLVLLLFKLIFFSYKSFNIHEKTLMLKHFNVDFVNSM